MSRDDDRAAVVALVRRTGVDRAGVADRVETDGAHRALDDELTGAEGQGVLLADDPESLIAAAAAQIRRWRETGLRVVTVLDEAYPVNLRGVHDRPALVLVAGDPAAVAADAVAIVGSRHASDAGRDRAAALAHGLVAAGCTVVSGLAAGIDTAAHRAALRAGGRTVAVIGTGHDHAYPPTNAELQARLVAEHAVVSPFWPETRPSRAGFRLRNGVMSGLSRGTVIVEASATSGTRVQARLALGHGRPVALLRSVLDRAWAVELARRPGVHVVDTADEVLAILAPLHDAAPPHHP